MRFSSFPAVAGIVLGLSLPVAAQQTQFDPSIAGEAAYSDNLNNAGTGATSDTAYRLSVDLPVVRTWKTGQLRFRYNPSLYRYQDESGLDRTDHAADFSLTSKPSRRGSLGFNARFSRTQVQGTFTALDDADITLTDRADRDRLDADLSYDLQVAPRWTWNVAVGFGTLDNKTIPGYTQGGLQDRDQTRLSTGFGRQVSQKTTVGMNLRYQENKLAAVGTLAGGDEKVRNANVYVKHRVDQKNSINLSAGYFSTDTMIAGATDRSGAFVSFSYSRDFRRVSLATFAGYRPTSGGNLPGTATLTNVGVSINGRDLQKWNWGLSGVFARRDPADPTAAEIDALGLLGRVTWIPHRKIGVRLSAAKNSQSDNAPMSVDIDVFRATLGVVWYPRG